MPTNSTGKTSRCAVCAKPGIRLRHMTRSYGRGPRLLVVENVPVLVCPHCGESYVTADTLHALERIKLDRRKLAAPRRVAVATFTPRHTSGHERPAPKKLPTAAKKRRRRGSRRSRG
ncbi:MAG: type II toxin-antitoxin system MqsA family antitoxin [bacterium]